MNPSLTRASKEAFAWLAFSLFVLLLVSASESCTPFGKSVARSVLDISQSVCIVANSDKPDSEVKAICGVLDALDEPMRELLKSSRERVAQERERVAFSKDVECHFRGLDDVKKDGGR